MDTNRLSKKMEVLLNNQVTKEAEAAQTYLSYGCWVDSIGFVGIANYLLQHSQEERDHMTKVIRYIMQRGGKVTIGSIKNPPANPKNLQDCFEKIFKHEVENTQAIYNIVNLAQDEKDWATYNFAQWFVKEQIEEEKLAMELLNKLKIAGGLNATSESLFQLDSQMKKESGELPLT